MLLACRFSTTAPEPHNITGTLRRLHDGESLDAVPTETLEAVARYVLREHAENHRVIEEWYPRDEIDRAAAAIGATLSDDTRQTLIQVACEELAPSEGYEPGGLPVGVPHSISPVQRDVRIGVAFAELLGAVQDELQRRAG